MQKPPTVLEQATTVLWAFALVTGLIILGISLALTGWNEYRDADNTKKLLVAKENYKDVSCDSDLVDGTNNSLIHLACPITGLKNFSVSLLSIDDTIGTRLEVSVQVLQYVETASRSCNRGKGGESCSTSYSYDRAWSSSAPQTRFADPTGCSWSLWADACRNVDPSLLPGWTDAYPGGGPAPAVGTGLAGTAGAEGGATVLRPPAGGGFGAPYPRETRVERSDAMLGRFVLPDDMIDTVGFDKWSRTLYFNIPGGTPVSADSQANLRVTFRLRSALNASVLAMGVGGNNLAPWPSPYNRGNTLYSVVAGLLSADDMITVEKDGNEAMTWYLRFSTWIAILGSLYLVLSALIHLDTTGHFLEDVRHWAVLGVLDCFLTCGFWCVVAGSFWATYRPAVGLPLLILGAIVLVALALARLVKKPPARRPGAAEPGKDSEPTPAAAPPPFLPMAAPAAPEPAPLGGAC